MSRTFSRRTKASRIDLNDVRLFIQAARAGSFSRTARELGTPVATVSRRVARLEAALGVTLFLRTTRRLSLTNAGERYLQEVTDGLQMIDSAGAVAAAQASTPAGSIRVTAPIDMGTLYLTDWFGQFLLENPAVSIEMQLSDQPLDLVAERIDIAFRTGPVRPGTGVARKLGDARRFLVASPDYLAKHGEPRSIADLASHACVVAGCSIQGARWQLHGPQGEIAIDIHGRISVNSAGAVVRAAAAGLGVALAPEGLARPLIEAGRLRQILPGYSVIGGSLHAHLTSRSKPSLAQHMLIDFVAGKFRELAAQNPPPAALPAAPAGARRSRAQ